MSDRERWIVYPLLLMALGMAAAPRLAPGTGRFEDLRCARLYCNEVVANQANVKGELEAARMKTGIVTAGVVKSEFASVDAISSKQHSTQRVRLTDALGVLQAELLTTESGGRLDLTRYAKASNLPLQDRDMEIFVQNAQRLQIPLGVAHIHVLPAEKPPEKPAANEPEAKEKAKPAEKESTDDKTPDAAKSEEDAKK